MVSDSPKGSKYRLAQICASKDSPVHASLQKTTIRLVEHRGEDDAKLYITLKPTHLGVSEDGGPTVI